MGDEMKKSNEWFAVESGGWNTIALHTDKPTHTGAMRSCYTRTGRPHVTAVGIERCPTSLRQGHSESGDPRPTPCCMIGSSLKTGVARRTMRRETINLKPRFLKKSPETTVVAGHASASRQRLQGGRTTDMLLPRGSHQAPLCPSPSASCRRLPFAFCFPFGDGSVVLFIALVRDLPGLR